MKRVCPSPDTPHLSSPLTLYETINKVPDLFSVIWEHLPPQAILQLSQTCKLFAELNTTEYLRRKTVRILEGHAPWELLMDNSFCNRFVQAYGLNYSVAGTYKGRGDGDFHIHVWKEDPEEEERDDSKDWLWDKAPWRIIEGNAMPTYQLCVLSPRLFALWGDIHNMRNRPGPLSLFTLPEVPGEEHKSPPQLFCGTSGHVEDVTGLGVVRETGEWYVIADAKTDEWACEKEDDYDTTEDHTPEVMKLYIKRGTECVKTVDFSHLMRAGQKENPKDLFRTPDTQFLADGPFILINFENELSIFDVCKRAFVCQQTPIVYSSSVILSHSTFVKGHFDPVHNRVYGITDKDQLHILEMQSDATSIRWKPIFSDPEVENNHGDAESVVFTADRDFFYLTRDNGVVLVIDKTTGRPLQNRAGKNALIPFPQEVADVQDTSLQISGEHLVLGFCNGSFYRWNLYRDKPEPVSVLSSEDANDSSATP